MVLLGGAWLLNELAQPYLPQIWWANLLLLLALCLTGAIWWRRIGGATGEEVGED